MLKILSLMRDTRLCPPRIDARIFEKTSRSSRIWALRLAATIRPVSPSTEFICIVFI
jgi:hypothetical protein